MIDKIKETLGQIFHSPEASGTWEEQIECAIDEEIVECDEMDSPPYTGVPAPPYLKEDEWFGAPVISDANKDYMELEYEAFKQDAHNYYGEQSKEPENIHEVMYEMATKTGKTTTQLDPLGGSETFQEGPGGWMSGTGYQGQGLTDH